MVNFKKVMMASAGSGFDYWVGTVNDSTITSGSYGGSIKMDVNSSGSVAVALNQWGANNKAAVIQLSANGTLEWSNIITKGSNNTLGYGLAIDSSDNVYVPVIGSTTTNFVIYKFNSSGSVQQVAGSGGWSDETFQTFDIYDDDIYHNRKYVTLGSVVYKEDAGTLSGTPDWKKRFYPSNSWFPNCTFYGPVFTGSGDRYTVYGYRGSGSSSTPLIYTLTNAGLFDTAKDVKTSGGTYASVDHSPSKLAHYNGNFFINFKQSPDSFYIDEVVFARLAYPYTSYYFSKTFNYSTRNRLTHGPVLASSTGDIHCMLRISNSSDSNSGFWLETFDDGGTFQSELHISAGAGNYIVGECLIDSNDDIYISGRYYVSSIYAGYKPFVMKIPSDYSTIGGTYGDWTLTYATSSTFTISTPFASVTTPTTTNDTSVSISFGSETDNSSSSSTISLDQDGIQ